MYQSLSLGLSYINSCDIVTCSCDAGYSDYLACWLISILSELTSAQHLEGLRMETLSQLLKQAWLLERITHCLHLV